ncbi:MAG: hypothetical protein K2R98_31790 [Gemmataceae bacterium]|nr:hypothetical protein [Gemmataceae bacterium]
MMTARCADLWHFRHLLHRAHVQWRHCLSARLRGTTDDERPSRLYMARFNAYNTLPLLRNDQTIEDFNSSQVYHLVYRPPTFQPSQTASHEGGSDYGMIDNPGTNWIYRDNASAQVLPGETISVWLQFHTSADGQAAFAFGANSNADGTPNGTYALVLDASTQHLMIVKQTFAGAGTTTTLATSALTGSIQADHWYRLKVEWKPTGNMTGQLFDNDGITLLRSVQTTIPDSTFLSGGIGFHATGTQAKYWDTVTEF